MLAGGAVRPALQTLILVIGVKVGSPRHRASTAHIAGITQQPCDEATPSLNAGPDLGEEIPVSGIYMIIVFLVVMAALNRFEFGRFD